MLDHAIAKPPSLQGYALHRLVEALAPGGRVLFADCGDHIIVRSAIPVTESGKPPRRVEAGGIAGFELRACVSKKRKGKHVYFRKDDWRSRHDWLRAKGVQHGFEVLAVHCVAAMASIDDGKGRRFTVDQTNFTGILRVADTEKFTIALSAGIGSVARAFGFGLLVI